MVQQHDVFFEACRTGNLELVRNMLATNPEYIADYDTYCYQFTPLHWGAQTGNVELVELLLSTNGPKVDINAKETKFGSTPMHMAYYTGKIKIYKALVDAGADCDARNKFSETCLHLAAKAGFADCCELLIKADANVNATQRLGNTPLHWACLLKPQGTSEEEAEDDQLHPVCEALISGGAVVNITNRDGATPMHVACKKGNLAACNSLIKAKAKVNVKDKNYHPLHYAAFNGHEKVCKALLDAGADATTMDGKLGSPLHYASHTGHIAICELLLNANPSLHEVKNHEDKTALDIAIDAGYSRSRLVEILKSAKKQRNGSLSEPEAKKL